MNHDSAHRIQQCFEAYEQARREIDAMREELDQIRAELDETPIPWQHARRQLKLRNAEQLAELCELAGLRRWRLGIKRADLPRLAALRAEYLEAGQ